MSSRTLKSLCIATAAQQINLDDILGAIGLAFLSGAIGFFCLAMQTPLPV